jgi:hypothetical protein
MSPPRQGVFLWEIPNTPELPETQAVPQPLDENIVQRPPAPIHADRHAAPFPRRQELCCPLQQATKQGPSAGATAKLLNGSLA